VLRGCARISRDRKAKSIDSLSVLSYADIINLDRLTSFERRSSSSVGKQTRFLSEDIESLRSVLTGPRELRYAPLPSTVWKAVWEEIATPRTEFQVDDRAIREISCIANRGLLELLAAAYIYAWSSVSNGVNRFRELGIEIEQRPQRVVISQRHISVTCSDLPFPLNILR
jgi:hypothetical protein